MLGSVGAPPEHILRVLSLTTLSKLSPTDIVREDILDSKPSTFVSRSSAWGNQLPGHRGEIRFPFESLYKLVRALATDTYVVGALGRFP